MKPFKYCPACATELERLDDGGGKCPSCGRSWYRNPGATVGCVIVEDGRALVSVRAREPDKGRIDVPGGFLSAGEHPIDGLRREVKEELGVDIDVDVDDCLTMEPATYGAEQDPTLNLGFKARVVDGEPTPSDDVAQVKWVSAHEIDDLDFAWPHDRELVRRALEHG